MAALEQSPAEESESILQGMQAVARDVSGGEYVHVSEREGREKERESEQRRV